MNDVMCKISNLFENKRLSTTILKGSLPLMEKVFRDIETDISKAEASDELVKTCAKESEITEVVYLIKNTVLFEALTTDALSFYGDFILVMFNWNNNIGKIDKLTVEFRMISQFVKGEFTMRDTIEVMKTLGNRLSRLKEWNPPAFNISESLFNALK